MDKKYVISMIALTSRDKQPRLYILGLTRFEMIPILCDYDDSDVWLFAEDIKTAKEIWNEYKDKVFEKYGEYIQKKNIFISEIKMILDKVEDIGERYV